VPGGVVDGLEPVDVEHHERRRRPPQRLQRHRVRHRLVQRPAIPETGERVDRPVAPRLLEGGAEPRDLAAQRGDLRPPLPLALRQQRRQLRRGGERRLAEPLVRRRADGRLHSLHAPREPLAAAASAPTTSCTPRTSVHTVSRSSPWTRCARSCSPRPLRDGEPHHAREVAPGHATRVRRGLVRLGMARADGHVAAPRLRRRARSLRRLRVGVERVVADRLEQAADGVDERRDRGRVVVGVGRHGRCRRRRVGAPHGRASPGA
jgi:hypothetical protein